MRHRWSMCCRLGIGEGAFGRAQSLVDFPEHPQREGIVYFRYGAGIIPEPIASDPCYYAGVDLGQSRDPTAIAVVRRVEPPGSVLEDDFGLKPKPNYAHVLARALVIPPQLCFLDAAAPAATRPSRAVVTGFRVIRASPARGFEPATSERGTGAERHEFAHR